MYLQPWQIFLSGCLCGIFVTFIVLVVVLIRIATYHGVEVRHENNEKENDENGREL
jgi:hypothetical protein